MQNAWFINNEKHNSRYSLIYVHSNSNFTMNGGAITDNTLAWYSCGTIDAVNSELKPNVVLNGGTVIRNYSRHSSDENDTTAYDVTFTSWSEDGGYYMVSDQAVTSGWFFDYSEKDGKRNGLSPITPNP